MKRNFDKWIWTIPQSEMTCAPHTTEALGSISKPDGGKVSGLQREDPKFAEGKRASVWQRKNLLGRKQWCIPNAPSSENFPVVSIKKTDSCFQRWEEPGRGAGGSPGKGSIAQGIGCGSKKLWRPYPEWIWQGLGTDQTFGTTSIWPFCPLDPCPQCMLLVCLLSGDTTALAWPSPAAGVKPVGQTVWWSGCSHHNLSNGNRWEAAAFSLLVFLEHSGFCSSASRFWGQEAASILAASAWELVPSSSSEESPPPAAWGATASLLAP